MKSLILNGMSKGPSYDFLSASILKSTSPCSIVQLVEYIQREDSFKVDINGEKQITLNVAELESYNDTMCIGVDIVEYDTKTRTFVMKGPGNIEFELNLGQLEQWIDLLHY